MSENLFNWLFVSLPVWINTCNHQLFEYRFEISTIKFVNKFVQIVLQVSAFYHVINSQQVSLGIVDSYVYTLKGLNGGLFGWFFTYLYFNVIGKIRIVFTLVGEYYCTRQKISFVRYQSTLLFCLEYEFLNQ